MAIKRKIWLNGTLNCKYPCPNCNDGTLTLQDKGFHEEQTLESILEDKEISDGGVASAAYTQYYNFIGILQCSNCKDHVSVCGDSFWSEYLTEEDIENKDAALFPKFFFPTLHIFPIPTNTPLDVKEELLKAFSLFWVDGSSCVNKIRTTIEILLDKQKVKRTIISKKGKREKITLHQRITIYGRKNVKLSNLLEAAKWLGNIGSHGKIEDESVLTAFDLLEYFLEEIYDSRAKKYELLSKRIIKSKGKLK
jgi:hypothetical protein